MANDNESPRQDETRSLLERVQAALDQGYTEQALHLVMEERRWSYIGLRTHLGVPLTRIPAVLTTDMRQELLRIAADPSRSDPIQVARDTAERALPGCELLLLDVEHTPDAAEIARLVFERRKLLAGLSQEGRLDATRVIERYRPDLRVRQILTVAEAGELTRWVDIFEGYGVLSAEQLDRAWWPDEDATGWQILAEVGVHGLQLEIMRQWLGIPN